MHSKRTKTLSCACTFLVLALFSKHSIYGTTNTNIVSLSSIKPEHLVDPNFEGSSVSLRYKQEVLRAAKVQAFNKFDYPAMYKATHAYLFKGYGLHTWHAERGRDLVTATMFDAVQETAVAFIPFENIEDVAEKGFAKFVAYFVRGTIGNTLEKNDPSVSAVPTYYTIQNFSISVWNKQGNTEYGLRTLRIDPYLYIEHRIDRDNKDELPLALVRLRCYSDLDPSSFGLIKIEPSLICPISASSHLILGASINVNRLYQEDHRPSGSIRWEHIYKHRIYYAGYVQRPYGNLIQVGMSYRF